ncbi:MAG TPA: PEGA domain-containing protein, partial [Kofleriaceae bacterium]|nr:PEGA domain-containing protein [Kofleriaceae bacterium]
MRVLTTLLLLTGLAHADVGVVTTGEPMMQAPVLAQVQGWLQQHQYGLVAVPLGDAANSFMDCFVMEDMGCAQKSFEKDSKASNLIYVRADLMAGQARDFNLIAYWFVKGHEPVLQKRECHGCDDAKLGPIVGSLMTDLEKGISSTKGHLKITSVLGGVSVTIDNVSLGAAPLEHDLDPGPHEISFLHRGKVLETKPLKIEPGATVEMAAPTLTIEAPPPAKQRSRALPVSLAVVGAALAVTG